MCTRGSSCRPRSTSSRRRICPRIRVDAKRGLRGGSLRVAPELRCRPHGLPFATEGGAPTVEGAPALVCARGCRAPVVAHVPRFVGSGNYAEAFGLQWKAFRTTQLDSRTGTTISRDRLERCLGGSLDVVRGKSVLEAGCGAGRFTELLLAAGAHVVAADLSAAVEANYENCGAHAEYFVLQGDVRSLPVAPRSFDVVLCLGVIQHTPDPEETIASLSDYVRPGGLLAIDHYAPGYPVTRSRRVLRQRLLRMPPDRAKRVALGVARAFLPLHRALWRDWRGAARLRRYLGRVSPLVDYYDAYPQLGRERLGEWAVLDTHDTLTDRYKHLRSADAIRLVLTSLGLVDVEVAPGGNGVEARARRPAAAPSPSEEATSMSAPARTEEGAARE